VLATMIDRLIIKGIIINITIGKAILTRTLVSLCNLFNVFIPYSIIWFLIMQQN